jgi:hypothetical protein
MYCTFVFVRFPFAQHFVLAVHTMSQAWILLTFRRRCRHRPASLRGEAREASKMRGLRQLPIRSIGTDLQVPSQQLGKSISLSTLPRPSSNSHFDQGFPTFRTSSFAISSPRHISTGRSLRQHQFQTGFVTGSSWQEILMEGPVGGFSAKSAYSMKTSPRPKQLSGVRCSFAGKKEITRRPRRRSTAGRGQ